MTEEIIIDGVNVAECEYLYLYDHYDLETGTEEWKTCNNKGHEDCNWTMCSDNTKCYYKKLQRLKQEHDELKRDNKRMKAILKGCGLEENGNCTYCNVDKAYHELKQENENAKTTVEECHKYMAKLEDENAKLLEKFKFMEIANDIKKQDIDSLREANEELRKALEEIRDMSKKSADVFDCTGCYDIYNKINEVLGNENN